MIPIFKLHQLYSRIPIEISNTLVDFNLFCAILNSLEFYQLQKNPHVH